MTSTFREEYEPLALTMANFKELVAAFEGGEKPRLADSSSYKPEIDVIIKFLGAHGARQANIDGSHRREAKRMVKENYPEIYKANKGIHLTSDKMYIGLSPEVGRCMSMKLNDAGHTVVGDMSMHKLLVAAAFSVWWDHMHPSYSFTHMNLKTILFDNQKTQIAGMKSRMTSWFKEKPWDETQRLRPDDFEKWPGLPLPMTEGEERAERAAAEKRRQEAAERRGDYVLEDDM
eukprot:jgi/Tetstr1/453504/TSEL_040473.t1